MPGPLESCQVFRSRLVLTEAGRAACEALGIRSAADLLAVAGGRVVSRSRTRSTVALETPGGTVYLKRYEYPTARHVLRGLLRGTFLGRSRVRRERENLARLRALGWGTAEPLAWGEARRLGFLRGAALLTRAIEGVERLDAAMARLGAAGAAGASERRGLARALGTAVRRLHDAGYVDGDMHPRNVLVRAVASRESRVASREFVKLDSPAGRMPWTRWGLRAGIVADLAALDTVAARLLPRTDRLRFLLAYGGVRRARVADEELAVAVTRARDGLRRREEPRLAEAYAHLAGSR